MLNFDFSGKGLVIVSSPHFMYDFSGKMFIVLYILLTDQSLYLFRYRAIYVLQFTT